MRIEIYLGVITILCFAIWAALYIRRSDKDTNRHTFDFIPHLFPTLGIFFTFLGIAIGLWNFDSNNIEKSIPELMNGLKTAFIVSIFGVALLVVFSFWTNVKRKKIEATEVNEELLAINKLIEVIENFRSDFHTYDEAGNLIKPGNVIRDIYEESTKQSNALLSFSTDLALTVSEGFERILNDPNEGVVAELKLVRAEIENLGNKMQDPATDMTQNIVEELKKAMSKMVAEFKNSMSGDTKAELTELVQLLTNTSKTLNDFPDNLRLMTSQMQTSFLELNKMVDKMADRINGNSIESVQRMNDLMQSMVDNIQGVLGNLQDKTESSIKDNRNNIKDSERMVGLLLEGVDKMSVLSTKFNANVEGLNSAHKMLDDVILSFKDISRNVNSSSLKFGEAQDNFSNYSQKFLEVNEETIKEIVESLDLAKDVSADYAKKFTIIENGLKDIFGKIDSGIKDYEKTVSQSLETYLGKYTDHLTKTAEALAAASSKQEFILELLSEQLSRLDNKGK